MQVIAVDQGPVDIEQDCVRRLVMRLPYQAPRWSKVLAKAPSSRGWIDYRFCR